MTSMVKCDLTGEIVNFEDTYQVTIYNRRDKTRCQIDVEHATLVNLMKGKGGKVTFAPRWQQWNKDNKSYEDVKSK